MDVESLIGKFISQSDVTLAADCQLLAAFTSAIEGNPSAKLFSNRALVHIRLRQFSGTIVDCKAALAYRSSSSPLLFAKVLFRLAISYFANGDLNEALLAIERSLECGFCSISQTLYNSIRISHEPGKMSIARQCQRRKLFDKGMQSFCLGNTIGSSIFRINDPIQLETPLRVLFLGVGDIRNVLVSLHDAESRSHDNKLKYEIVCNDIVCSTLARNVLLLAVLAEENSSFTTTLDDFISIWCNSLLTSAQKENMNRVLSRLINNNDDYDSWLQLHPIGSLRQLFSQWLSELSYMTIHDLYPIRQASFSTSYAVHEGATFPWLEYGMAYVRTGWTNFDLPYTANSPLTSYRVNPTLLNMNTLEYVDSQGPFQSFSDVIEYGSNNFGASTKFSSIFLSAALRRSWRPLLKSFITCLKEKRVRLTFIHGNSVDMMSHPVIATGGFHVIDTSNLVDYVGLWNVVIPCLSLLSPGNDSYIRTLSIFGMPMSSEAPPQSLRLLCDYVADSTIIESEVMRRLLRLLSLRCQSQSDFVAIWHNQGQIDTDIDSIDLRILRAANMYYTQIKESIPFSGTSEPVFSPYPSDAVEFLSHGWTYEPQGFSTCVLLLQRVLLMHSLSCSQLDSVIDDSNGRPSELQLLVGLSTLADSLGSSLSISLNKRLVIVRKKYEIDDVALQYVQIPIKPLYDLDGVRGGIFEPCIALMVVWSTNADSLRISMQSLLLASCSGAIERRRGDYLFGQQLIDWIMHRNSNYYEVVQLFDNIDYLPSLRMLSCHLPLVGRRNAYCCLVDVQFYEIISEIQSIAIFK